MSRNSCDECGGLTDVHTADCPNRVDDRAVVVAEVLAAHDWFTPRGYAWPCCTCGEEFPSNDEDDVRAHVAAAILAALDGAPAPKVQAARASVDEYEYVLVIEEHGMVGSGPTTDLRAVEQDQEHWSEAGKRGTIMRRTVNDWDVAPS